QHFKRPGNAFRCLPILLTHPCHVLSVLIQWPHKEVIVMEYPITNSTISHLKFIHRHQNCTFSEINTQCPKIDFMDLVNLSLTNYLLCTRPGEFPTQFQDGNFFIPENATFWATPHTIKLLEDRRREWLQWVIPNVIAGIAL